MIFVDSRYRDHHPRAGSDAKHSESISIGLVAPTVHGGRHQLRKESYRYVF